MTMNRPWLKMRNIKTKHWSLTSKNDHNDLKEIRLQLNDYSRIIKNYSGHKRQVNSFLKVNVCLMKSETFTNLNKINKSDSPRSTLPLNRILCMAALLQPARGNRHSSINSIMLSTQTQNISSAASVHVRVFSTSLLHKHKLWARSSWPPVNRP